MSDPLTILFFIALIVFVPTIATWLFVFTSMSYVQRQHARLRRYMETMPPVPVNPSPETAEARRVREACNDAICATLDAGSIAVMAYVVRARK